MTLDLVTPEAAYTRLQCQPEQLQRLVDFQLLTAFQLNSEIRFRRLDIEQLAQAFGIDQVSE